MRRHETCPRRVGRRNAREQQAASANYCTNTTYSRKRVVSGRPLTNPNVVKIFLFAALAMAMVLSATPAVKSVQLNPIAYVPITITNSAGSATPNPFQQQVTFNPSSYASYEATNLGNIRFCSDRACASQLYAWLESCGGSQTSCSDTATSATAWVKLTTAIAANGGTLTIYLTFWATSTPFDGVYWGESPRFSGTYAQYDNGVNVFSLYDNFAGTTLNSRWTKYSTSAGTFTVSNGLQLDVSSSTTGIGVYASFTALSTGNVVEGYTDAVDPVAGYRLGLGYGTTSSSSSQANGYVAIIRCQSSAEECISKQTTGTTTTLNTIADSVTAGNYYENQLVWYYVTSNTEVAQYVTQGHSTSATDTTYSLSSVTQTNIELGGGTSNEYVTYWFRIRAAPPSNSMPTPALGSATVVDTEDVTITPANGYSSSASVTISGCDSSVTTVAMNGVQHQFTADASCSITFTVPADTSTSRYRLNNAGSASTTWSYATSASGVEEIHTNTVYYQYLQTLSYSVIGGGSGYSAPSFTATQLGLSAPQTLTTSATGYWYDYGSSWSVTNPLGGSSGSEQWITTQSTSGTISSAQTIAFSYQNQYTITFTMNGHGSPSPASGSWENSGAVVPVTIGADGSNSSSTRYVVKTIVGSGSGSYSTSTSGTTQFSVTMNAAITETITWTTQYYLTMQAGVGGSVSPTSAWQNSGTNVTITATPSSGYVFGSWTCTGTGCHFGTANPSWVITNAAITETANFNQIVVTITVSNRTLATSSGGANMTSPQTVNPTVEYWYGTGVIDSQYSNDIQSITVDLYRTGHTPGTFASSFVYSFRWVANGWSGTPSCSTSPGCWQELQTAGWVTTGFNYLVQSDSSVTTISGSALTAKWQFAVKLDQLAVYTTNGAGLWNFKVTAVSKSNGNPYGTRAGTFDVNLFVSITVPGNMDWGTVAAGSINATASGMPVYTTYTANAIVTITIYGGGDPTSQYGDSFPLSFIYVGKTSSHANNDGVALSTSSTVIYGSLPVAANSNLPMYWFISTPNPFTPGTYTFTYYEVIQLQSMQS